MANPNYIPTFNPSDSGPSDSLTLIILDSLMARGLSEEDFYSFFRQCNVCENVMAEKSVQNHICPGHAAIVKADRGS